MKIRNRPLSLLILALFLSTTVSMAPAYAQQPPFAATINISGETEIELGESTTLTADWTTNRDVTRYEWSVDYVGQGIVSIDGASSGIATFDFTPNEIGEYEITFRIWHHLQTDRDASESITVTVTDPVEPEIEYEYETAFAYCELESTPFSDYGFSRWGWTIGPLSYGSYTFDLYVGAGQNDLSKGILVGTVDVVYDATSFAATFNVNSPYVLGETHVYAGQGMFPQKDAENTVAPGQYYIDLPASEGIYTILHAEVGIPL